MFCRGPTQSTEPRTKGRDGRQAWAQRSGKPSYTFPILTKRGLFLDQGSLIGLDGSSEAYIQYP